MIRTRTLARLSAMAVAVTVGLTLTACSSSATNMPDPESMNIDNIVETASSVTYDVNAPVTTDANGATAEDLKEYLESPERSERFEAVIAAGWLVAQKLDKGYFGKPYRYTGFQDDPNYIGWGGLTTKDAFNRDPETVSEAPFVWVWFDHGNIESTYPITNMSIPFKGNADNTNVVFAGPVEGMNYWSVDRYIDGVRITSFAALDLVTAQGWTVPTGVPNAYFPKTLEEYKQLDDAALAQLEANLISWDLTVQ